LGEGFFNWYNFNNVFKTPLFDSIDSDPRFWIKCLRFFFAAEYAYCPIAYCYAFASYRHSSAVGGDCGWGVHHHGGVPSGTCAL
jgi:hypothetical protein